MESPIHISSNLTKSKQDEHNNHSTCCLAIKYLLWPSFFIILVVTLGVIATRPQRVERGQEYPQTATEPHSLSLFKESALFLEDYFSFTSFPPQYDLEHIEIHTNLLNSAENTVPANYFYYKCVKHLRKSMPNLKEVILVGHVSNPAKINAAQENLAVIDEAFKKNNIVIKQFKLEVDKTTNRNENLFV